MGTCLERTFEDFAAGKQQEIGEAILCLHQEADEWLADVGGREVKQRLLVAETDGYDAVKEQWVYYGLTITLKIFYVIGTAPETKLQFWEQPISLSSVNLLLHRYEYDLENLAKKWEREHTEATILKHKTLRKTRKRASRLTLTLSKIIFYQEEKRPTP